MEGSSTPTPLTMLIPFFQIGTQVFLPYGTYAWRPIDEAPGDINGSDIYVEIYSKLAKSFQDFERLLDQVIARIL